MDRRQLFRELVGRAGVGAPDIYRYERKYVISEASADAIRAFVTPHLAPDEHMKPDERRGYQVFSLYLDDLPLSMYRQTVEGIRIRYKLRIRFYDTADDGLALLEIKSRSADAIHKQRAAVTKSSVANLLRGGALSTADLLSPSDSSIRALGEFCRRRARLGAEGSAFVAYWREAYVSRLADTVRVTMDRQLVARDGRLAGSLRLPAEAIPAASDRVVLELKYGGRTPSWMRDLVRTFGLQRVSFPKYVHCVDALQLGPPLAHRFSERAPC